MTFSSICPKGSQEFCYLCAKQGVTSKLVQYHVNLKEAILLCVSQACVCPLGSRDISSFIVQNTIKETSSEVELKPVFTPTDDGVRKSDKKLRESRHHFLTFISTTEEQTKSSANSMLTQLTQLIPEMDRWTFPFCSEEQKVCMPCGKINENCV